MNNDLKHKLNMIFMDVFPSHQFPNKIYDMKIGDIPEWDSLGNFNLLLAIEAELSIRFSLDDFSELKSFKQILYTIEKLI